MKNNHLKISVEFQHFIVSVQISSVWFKNMPNLLSSIFQHLNFFLSVEIQFSINLFKSKIPKSALFRQPMLGLAYMRVSLYASIYSNYNPEKKFPNDNNIKDQPTCTPCACNRTTNSSNLWAVQFTTWSTFP